MEDSTQAKSVLTKQIEFYFGDSNMYKSTYMQQEVAKDKEGCMFFFLRHHKP